jgi:hypothetical protein
MDMLLCERPILFASLAVQLQLSLNLTEENQRYMFALLVDALEADVTNNTEVMNLMQIF